MKSLRFLLRFGSGKIGNVRTLVIPPAYQGQEPSKTFEEVTKYLSETVIGGPNYFDPKAYEEQRKTLIAITPKSRDELPPRRMQDSFDHALLPLSTDVKLRERYLASFGGVRLGRLLEDMDVFAVHLVFKHVLNPRQGDSPLSPFSIVTGLVDKIDVKSNIYTDEDIKMSGHVTWVGTSSAESTIVLHQRRKNSGGGKWVRITDATFVLVCRDAVNTGKGFINPLVLESDEEKMYFERGVRNKERRKILAKESLFEKPPTEEETSVIHDFFIKTIDHKALTFKARIKPENTVWMEDAKLKTMILCQPENRNRFNKIFGGFIMRQALELAWANTYIFAKAIPSFMYMDDILFKEPVEVGSLLYFNCQICYTKGNHIQTRVSAEIMNPETSELRLSNLFQYTLKVNKPIPKIIPKTYHEAMMYLNARRHYINSTGD